MNHYTSESVTQFLFIPPPLSLIPYMLFASLKHRIRLWAQASLLLLLFLLCQMAVPASSNWSRQSSGTFAWLHAVYFLDENRGWAVGGNGALVATRDGGKSWAAMRRPTEDALRDLYFADERQGWLVCERSIYLLKEKDEPRTYLMRTTDGGATWQRVNVTNKDADARLVRALFTTKGRGWAFGEAGALYTTRDGGGTWARQRVPTQHLLLGGAFHNADEGWLVGAGATVLQTADGGETWRAGTVVSGVRSMRFTAVSFVDRMRGWAVGMGGRVFATTDGGRNWRAQTSNVRANLYDVKFLDAREGWAVGAEGTVIHTMDGGQHWSVVLSATTHPLERLFFVNRERGWAVGFGGTIISYAPTRAPRAPELKSRS